METNRENPQQSVTRSNENHDKCILNLSITTVCLCTVIMVTVAILHWTFLSSHPSTMFHTILLVCVLVLYMITTINSLVIILKIDMRKRENQICSEQSNDSSANEFQRSMIDHISLPDIRETRFEDVTIQPNYSQAITHRNNPIVSSSKSEKSIYKASTSRVSRENGFHHPSRYEAVEYEMSDLGATNHCFEMNLPAPQHQNLINLSDTTADNSTMHASDISQEQRFYLQVDPIYENMSFSIKRPTNARLNVFDNQKPKCEKLNVAKVLKSNVDFAELNNGQQLMTVRKSPARNSSFQKSIAQKFYSKHTAESRNIALLPDAIPPVSFTAASTSTRPSVSSESVSTCSSEVSLYQENPHAISSSVSQGSKNKPITSELTTNPYVSSALLEPCSVKKVTSFSSASPRTSTVLKVSPSHKMVCTPLQRVAPSYSEGALNEAFPQNSNVPSASASYEYSTAMSEDQYRAKFLPEKSEPDQRSIQKKN